MHRGQFLEHDVDYVVRVDDIGDPKGIMSGATRYTKDPKELLIAKTAANVVEAAGYLYDGFSMQMGFRAVHRLQRRDSSAKKCWIRAFAVVSLSAESRGRSRQCMKKG